MHAEAYCVLRFPRGHLLSDQTVYVATPTSAPVPLSQQTFRSHHTLVCLLSDSTTPSVPLTLVTRRYGNIRGCGLVAELYGVRSGCCNDPLDAHWWRLQLLSLTCGLELLPGGKLLPIAVLTRVLKQHFSALLSQPWLFLIFFLFFCFCNIFMYVLTVQEGRHITSPAHTL